VTPDAWVQHLERRCRDLEERVKLADRPHFGRALSARSNSKSFFPELADDSTETMPSPPRLIRSRS